VHGPELFDPAIHFLTQHYQSKQLDFHTDTAVDFLAGPAHFPARADAVHLILLSVVTVTEIETAVFVQNRTEPKPRF